ASNKKGQAREIVEAVRKIGKRESIESSQLILYWHNLHIILHVFHMLEYLLYFLLYNIDYDFGQSFYFQWDTWLLQLLVPHGSLFIEKKIAVAVAHVLLHYLQAFGFYINIYAICFKHFFPEQEARHYEAVVTSQFALQADLVLMIMLLAYFTSKAVLHVSLVYFGMLDGLLTAQHKSILYHVYGPHPLNLDGIQTFRDPGGRRCNYFRDGGHYSIRDDISGLWMMSWGEVWAEIIILFAQENLEKPNKLSLEHLDHFKEATLNVSPYYSILKI
ncbi:hypothetical protein ACJX0J_035655, partial [Zea mays]